MAGKRRSVEPSIYRHPYLLRQPLATRYLFHYLIEMGADDEGRLRYDPVIICMECFSPVDGETPDTVASMIEALVAGGLVKSYRRSGERFLFLVGWYEHQKIDKRMRSESSLPPPPVPINSWAAVDAVKLEYAEARGLQDPDKAQSREAIRWKTQQGYSVPRSRARVTRESPDTQPTFTRESPEIHAPDLKRNEGIGRETKRRELPALSPPPPPTPAPAPPPPAPSLSLSAQIAHRFARDPKDRRALETALKKWPPEAQQAAADDLQRRLDHGEYIRNQSAYLNALLPIKSHLVRGAPNNGTEFEAALAQARLWMDNGADRAKVMQYLALDFPHNRELQVRVITEVFGQ
jgi:hypothetical protein